MFESFKARAEAIDQSQFESFLEDTEFQSLVADVEKRMIFSQENESEEGPDSFETASGYGYSLSTARNWLDKKGVRVSDTALARAIARHMGGDEFANFIE